ncbi:MAG: GAF domain-containing protein [Dehalococcoidia bacterium]|nr:GAF domain-containing protein [Dehalococcoidia bacterium]
MTEIGSLPYAFPPAVAAASGLMIIAIVMRWAPPSPSRRMFIVMVSGLVLWGATILGMRLSTHVPTALVWDRWAAVAIMVMFLGFYHFSLLYTHTSGRRWVLALAYAVVAVILAASPAGALIEDLRIEEYGYAPVSGFLAVPAMFTALGLLLGGVSILVRRYRSSTSLEERTRLLYLIAGASLPLVGTILDIVSNLPPVGIWTNILFCAVSAVALLGYRLLDIPQVARRTLTYLVLGVMVAIPYVLTLLLMQQIFHARLEGLWGYIVTVLFLAVFLRPLYSAAQGLVDRVFYRERYDALRALEQFGREAQHEVHLEALACRLTSLVTQALHATRTCLFLPAENADALLLMSCDGQEPLPQSGSFSRRSALVRWMEDHPEILAHRVLDIEPQLQSLSPRDRSLLESIDADILAPVTSASGQLSGLLILGKNQSRRQYSNDDRRLLEALGRQMAISLDNARLYSDAVRGRHDLERWLDGMDDSIVIMGQNRIIRFLNRSARVHLGVSVGDPCWGILGAGQECDQCALEDAWSGEAGSVRMSRRLGQREYEIVAAQLSNPDGERSLIAVLRDVTDRNRVEDDLRRSREQLRELAIHQESVREDERAGIARELHDELGQLLTALRIDLTWLKSHIPDTTPQQSHLRLTEMISLTDTAVSAVQRMSSQLSPGILDDLGLVAALEWLARDFQQRSGIRCPTDVDSTLDVSGHRATVLFRICQESLTNVVRHSGASEVTVSLSRRDSEIVLVVSDNGRGITPEQMEDPRSYGVMGMRERARALGGRVVIHGVPGEGTSVEAALPLDGTE